MQEINFLLLIHCLKQIHIDNVMLHIQYFRQHNTQFLNSYQPRRQIYCYSSIEKLHLLKNISIVPYENEYEICFCGDGYSWPYMEGGIIKIIII